MNPCPSCGVLPRPGAKFCDRCGERLTDDSPPAPATPALLPDPERGWRRRRSWGLAGVGASLLLGLVLGLAWLMPPDAFRQGGEGPFSGRLEDYRNDELRFSARLPAGWSARPPVREGGMDIVVFVPGHGGGVSLTVQLVHDAAGEGAETLVTRLLRPLRLAAHYRVLQRDVVPLGTRTAYRVQAQHQDTEGEDRMQTTQMAVWDGGRAFGVRLTTPEAVHSRFAGVTEAVARSFQYQK